MSTATAPSRAQRPAPAVSSVTGAGSLIGFVLRRDRVRLTVWVVAVAAFFGYFGFALRTLFGDPAALQGRADIMQTPAGIVMAGPGYGTADYTIGAAIANEGGMWVVVALSVFALQHVVRHTRAEEESGHAGLVRAGAVGRHADLLATVLTLVLALGTVTALSTVALVGAAGVGFADSLALTLGASLSALVLGGVAVVLVQVLGQARAAVGAGLGVLGLAVVVRVAGDLQELGGSTLSWFSPIAWTQQLRAFVDLRWWPMLLSVAAAAALIAVGAWLSTRRDVGDGLVRTRAGSPHAPAWMRGPVGLAWRQQRVALVSACVGLGLIWFGTGTLLPEIGGLIDDLAADNTLVSAVFGERPELIEQGFLGVIVLYAALCASAYGIAMAGRAVAEERARHADAVLALPVGRVRWLGSQVGVAALGSLVLFAVSTAALWLGAVVVGADGPDAGDHLVVLVGHLPAVLLFVALACALTGWAPRVVPAAWGLLSFALIWGLFSGVFSALPEQIGWLSPFHWVPQAFLQPFDGVAFAVLTLVALAVTALGLLGFRRRDLESG